MSVRLFETLTIDEISPVDAGGHQLADIVLLKSLGGQPNTHTGEAVVEILKLLGLAETATAEDVAVAISKLKAAHVTAATEAGTKVENALADKATVETKLAEVEKKLADATRDPNVIDPALPEEVRKQLGEFAEVKKALAAKEVEIAKSVVIAKAKTDYADLTDHDTLGAVLFIVEKADKPLADKLAASLSAANARAKLAPVEKTLGTTSTATEGDVDPVVPLAKALQAERAAKGETISIEKAYTLALEANPNLYDGTAPKGDGAEQE